MVCGQALRIEEQPWHIHHRVWRSQGGQETCDNLDMLHANCHRQIHSKKESLKDQAASCKGRYTKSGKFARSCSTDCVDWAR